MRSDACFLGEGSATGRARPCRAPVTMRASHDRSLCQRVKVKVGDGVAAGRLDREVQHLIEITIVELAVPSDANE